MTDIVDQLVDRVRSLEERVDALLTLLAISNVAIDSSLRDYGSMVAYHIARYQEKPLSVAQRALIAKFLNSTDFVEMFGRDHGPSPDPADP